MLEKPDLQDESIIACLQNSYDLSVTQIAFLPLGVDTNTAVYRAAGSDGADYFVKLRRGAFDEITVTLPHYLSGSGIAEIIPPLPTRYRRLWTEMDAFKVTLYPFIEGRDGYQVELSDRLWVEFGRALKSIHSVVIPPALLSGIPREGYSPQFRATVKTFMERIEQDVFDDPAAIELAAFLRAHRQTVLDLLRRASRLAETLQAQPPELTLCHSDLHAGNLLITARDAFYIVDWDNPILAPKERDLMFAGGGQFGNHHTLQEEETLFYRGYGPTPVNAAALAYYRYERIIEDLAAFCEQIFITDSGGEDRPQALIYLKSTFLPNGTLEIAFQSDRTVG